MGAGYQIPRVVIGENVTSKGAENSLRAGGAQVEVLQDEECIRMIREFIAKLSNEDIADSACGYRRKCDVQRRGEFIAHGWFQVEVLQDEECIRMREFIAKHPELWNEDIGV